MENHTVIQNEETIKEIINKLDSGNISLYDTKHESVILIGDELTEIIRKYYDYELKELYYDGQGVG